MPLEKRVRNKFPISWMSVPSPAAVGEKWRRVLTAIALVVALQPVTVLADAMSIQAFLALKPKWERLIGLKYQLEGRVSTAGGNVLVMRKLTGLNFVSAEKLPELRGADTVEIHGALARDSEERIIFNVTAAKKLISDMDRLNRVRVSLPGNKPDEWYKLADWAISRGSFYSDNDLVTAGRELYRQGLQREHTRLEVKDHQALKRLADRARDFQLGDELRIAFLYEGNYRDWQNERREGTSLQLAGIAERSARELPGAGTPMPDIPEFVRDAWNESPLFSYQSLDSSAARQQYHRLLYQEVMRQSIEIDRDPTGRNGVEIAARIRRQVPELGALAEEYIEAERNWRLRNVATLTQAKMLALRREFDELKQQDQADRAFDDWFQAREHKLLKQPGVAGLIDLADLYEDEDLKNDQAAAIRLLLMADRKKPGLASVGERLAAFGYRNVDGQWLDPDEVSARENSAINVAMREGNVVRGMTASQVTKTLGEPTGKTRILTGRNVIEYWVFGQSDSRLAVRLLRLANRREPIVDAFTELGR